MTVFMARRASAPVLASAVGSAAVGGRSDPTRGDDSGDDSGLSAIPFAASDRGRPSDLVWLATYS